jgi:hypothetical protein
MEFRDQETGRLYEATWIYFLPDCDVKNPLCDPMSGAYVSAITVALQRLKTSETNFNGAYDESFGNAFDI